MTAPEETAETGTGSDKIPVDKIAAKNRKSRDTLQPTGTLDAKFEPLGRSVRKLYINQKPGLQIQRN